MNDAEKDDLARMYGFDSFPALLAVSNPVLKQSGDTVQSYCARKPGGQWFIWRWEKIPPDSPGEPRYTIK